MSSSCARSFSLHPLRSSCTQGHVYNARFTDEEAEMQRVEEVTEGQSTVRKWPGMGSDLGLADTKGGVLSLFATRL